MGETSTNAGSTRSGFTSADNTAPQPAGDCWFTVGRRGVLFGLAGFAALPVFGLIPGPGRDPAARTASLGTLTADSSMRIAQMEE